MTRMLFVATLAVCAPVLAQGTRPAPIVAIDRIVAVVGSEVITQKELGGRLERALRELSQRGTPAPVRDQLERQVLERMITDRVQLQYAKETGVRVDDFDLDRTIARIAENNRLTVADFRTALERDGVPFERFREELREEIAVSRLREREVDSRIVIAESEIDNFIEEQSRTRSGGPMEFNLAHILLRVPEQARPEQLERQRDRAADLVRRLRGGEDFAQAAAAYSDAPDALQGGIMGWRTSDRLPDLFVEAVEKLQPGQVTEVLRSPAGFHVLKLIERRDADTPAPVEQTHVRHILVRTNEVVSEEDARRKLAGLRERLQNGADFAELARVHSEDGTAAKGGDLGWVYPGDTVPEFERAFASLAPGELSQPVKTPFGFHLMQVLGRRSGQASADRQRFDARKALRERKGDEAYQEWLRQLRDRAYVEYRLDER